MKKRAFAKGGLLIVLLLILVYGGFHYLAKAKPGKGLQEGGFQAKPAMQPLPFKEEIQSLKERQLVQLFHTLIQMDKKPELAIPPTEAERLLPIVKQSVTDGEMSPVDFKKIMDLLTKEQKAYYNDLIERNKKNNESQKQLNDKLKNMSEEERLKTISEMKKRRAEEGKKPKIEYGHNVEKNVEQQLMDLLENRLKNEEKGLLP